MESQEQDLRAGLKAQLERIPRPPAEETAPVIDPWVERRMRVFERALATLEAHHEKTQQDLSARIAFLEGRLASYEDHQHASAALPASVMDVENLPVQPVAASIAIAGPEAAPIVETKPVGDFLAQARRAANAASFDLPVPVKRKAAPRWMAWAAVGCVTAMTVTALALGTVAGASETAGAASHRQDADSFGKVVAMADSGDPRDQTAMAFAYLRGQHFAADHVAAERWAMAAAERGDPLAQYLVGAFYQSGDGVVANPAQAFHWFEASALRGNLKAMHNLAIEFARGDGTDKNPERAAAWFNRAAEQGYKDSQFDLAVLYERGDGVKQNAGRALTWYLVAARAGDKEAQSRATQLEQVMSSADVMQAETQAAGFVPAAHDLLANNL